MAKLGEAYVEVRADLTKFGKDLDRGLKTLTTKFETALNRDLGRRLGTDVGGGVREGLRDATTGMGREFDRELGAPRLRRRGRDAGRSVTRGLRDGLDDIGPIRRALSSIITALEDGFSSLPTEVKAIAGGLLLAAIIPLGGLLAGALSGAIILGLAGLGTALAFQFEEVEFRGKQFVDRLRLRFVNAASTFIGPLEQAFDIFDYRLNLLDPTIREVFDHAADYVLPLADGIANLVDETLRGLDRGLRALDEEKFGRALAEGFDKLGESIGGAFETILSNPDLPQTLEDLFTVASALVDVTAELLSLFTTLYRVFGQVSDVAGTTVSWLGDVVTLLNEATSTDVDADKLSEAWDRVTGAVDEANQRLVKGGDVHRYVRSEIGGTVKATEAETKAAKELNRQLKVQEDLINDIIGTNVDYQESIDLVIDGFKDHGTSLDADKEKGRDNIKNIQNQINSLKEYTKTQLASGKMTEKQAREYYNNEIIRLKDEFTKRHGNIKQFEEIFGWLEVLTNLPPVPDKFGPFKLSLRDTATLLGAVQAAVAALANMPKPKLPKRSGGSSSGPQAYADGGRITEPTFAMMGEGYRSELVLPETQPSRSMKLLSQSPLGQYVLGAPNVSVYIGNEQLEGRMYRVASNVNSATARNITQRPRSI